MDGPLKILDKPTEDFSEEERNQAREEWKKLSQLLSTFPKVPNYSSAKILLRGLVGPLARFWRRDGSVLQAGFERNGQKFLLGEAQTYRDALIQVAMTMAKYNAGVAVDRGAGFGSKLKGKVDGEGQQNQGGTQESKPGEESVCAVGETAQEDTGGTVSHGEGDAGENQPLHVSAQPDAQAAEAGS